MLEQITPLILTYNEAPNIGRTLAALAWARTHLASKSASSLRFAVKAVRADPEIAKRGRRGIRMLGTYVPGVITAGSFRQDGDRIFWNVNRPENVIVIELHDEPYAKLIIEVLEPAVTVATIHNTLSARAA